MSYFRARANLLILALPVPCTNSAVAAEGAWLAGDPPLEGKSRPGQHARPHRAEPMADDQELLFSMRGGVTPEQTLGNAGSQFLLLQPGGAVIRETRDATKYPPSTRKDLAPDVHSVKARKPWSKSGLFTITSVRSHKIPPCLNKKAFFSVLIPPPHSPRKQQICWHGNVEAGHKTFHFLSAGG